MRIEIHRWRMAGSPTTTVGWPSPTTSSCRSRTACPTTPPTSRFSSTGAYTGTTRTRPGPPTLRPAGNATKPGSPTSAPPCGACASSSTSTARRPARSTSGRPSGPQSRPSSPKTSTPFTSRSRHPGTRTTTTGSIRRRRPPMPLHALLFRQQGRASCPTRSRPPPNTRPSGPSSTPTPAPRPSPTASSSTSPPPPARPASRYRPRSRPPSSTNASNGPSRTRSRAAPTRTRRAVSGTWCTSPRSRRGPWSRAACARTQLIFQLDVVPRPGRTHPRRRALKLVIGPGDNHEPVATIMLPSED